MFLLQMEEKDEDDNNELEKSNEILNKVSYCFRVHRLKIVYSITVCFD